MPGLLHCLDLGSTQRRLRRFDVLFNELAGVTVFRAGPHGVPFFPAQLLTCII